MPGKNIRLDVHRCPNQDSHFCCYRVTLCRGLPLFNDYIDIQGKIIPMKSLVTCLHCCLRCIASWQTLHAGTFWVCKCATSWSLLRNIHNAAQQRSNSITPHPINLPLPASGLLLLVCTQIKLHFYILSQHGTFDFVLAGWAQDHSPWTGTVTQLLVFQFYLFPDQNTMTFSFLLCFHAAQSIKSIQGQSMYIPRTKILYISV